jgi:hypothetical protein
MVGVVLTFVSDSRGRSAQHSPMIPKKMICDEDTHEPSRSHQATSLESYASKNYTIPWQLKPTRSC